MHLLVGPGNFHTSTKKRTSRTIAGIVAWAALLTATAFSALLVTCGQENLLTQSNDRLTESLLHGTFRKLVIYAVRNHLCVLAFLVVVGVRVIKNLQYWLLKQAHIQVSCLWKTLKKSRISLLKEILWYFSNLISICCTRIVHSITTGQ